MSKERRKTDYIDFDSSTLVLGSPLVTIVIWESREKEICKEERDRGWEIKQQNGKEEGKVEDDILLKRYHAVLLISFLYFIDKMMSFDRYYLIYV